MSAKSSNGLGNEFRLKGLKNVNGRRRVQGDLPIIEDLENIDDDVSGIADQENLSQNLPQAEGGELDAQAYDVRANQVMTDREREAPENPDDMYNSRMHRLGKALKTQVPENEVMPEPEMAQAPTPDTYKKLESISSALPKESYENMTPEQKQVLENALLRNEAEEAARKNKNMPQTPPKANLVPPIATQQVEEQEGVPPMTPEGEAVAEGANLERMAPESAEGEALGQEARGTPGLNIEDLPKNEEEIGTKAVPGAVNEVISTPDLKSKMEEAFGVEITPEVQKQLTDMEAAVKGFTDTLEGAQTNLTEHQAYLQKKIENQDLSTGESILMAMSIIAPALVMGLIAGKEGVLGGIAGGAGAIASNLANREKDRDEAYKLKSELGIKGAKLGMEGLEAQQKESELKAKIKSSLPGAKMRELFNEVGGGIINDTLVFDTGNNLIPLKVSAVRRPEDYKQFMKTKMPELQKRVQSTSVALKNLDNIDKLIDRAEKMQKEQQYGTKNIQTSAKAWIPAARDTFTDEYGNQVKFEQAFQTELEQLSDAYPQALSVASSKGSTEGFRKHVKEQLSNPFTLESWWKGRTQLPSVKHNIRQIKKELEEATVSAFDTAGVETSPIKELFKNEPSNARATEEKRKKNRAHTAAREVIGE